MKKSIDLLNNHFKQNDIIIIACSGGPDSMCLLDLVHILKDSLNLTVIVCHVNHNLREESLSELEFVKKYALKNNDIFQELSISKEKKYTEEEYRNIRYDFFREVIKKYKANYLLTAHHGDDLIETVLMRIVRGSNLNGYSGIKAVIQKENYKVIRPLIYYTKMDILKYNEENGIKYVTDYTNDLDVYTRNRYRHKVLPFFKEENTKVHLKFLKYSEELQEAEDFINKLVNEYEVKTFSNNKLDVLKFNQLDEFIKKRIIINMLKSVYGIKLYYVDDNNIKEIIRILGNNRSRNIKFDLPKNYIGVIDYGYFSIIKKRDIENRVMEFSGNLYVNGFGTLKEVLTSQDKNNNIIRLNKKDITLPLYIRNRKNGDFMEVKGLNGKKKIKDIFIDEKVSITLRDSYPLLVDKNDNVLWIPGVKKSKFDKEKSEICDIIIKYEKEGMYE